MKDDFEDYKWVLSVSFEDGSVMYYNSFEYLLSGDPSEATRYKLETSEKIEDDKKFASCQGGTSKMILLSDAIKKTKK